tara:strand:+ start:586 stop:774 length:189 start_codon:yes stop_codon:yes gene_type:complete
MLKTRDQIIDHLCQKGFLNYLFDDKKFGKDFMNDYLLSIDSESSNTFFNKFIDYVVQQQEEN